MYVRRIKSRNSICFQIGYKESRMFKLIKHVGCAQRESEIEALQLKAQQLLHRYKHEGQPSLFPPTKSEKAKVTDWRITGYHQMFGYVYDKIGFPSNLLRHLVVARIAHPRSKLATVRYLKEVFGINVGADRLYRFLDTLDKKTLLEISHRYVHARGAMNLVFYDVTTLRFESIKEDELRSKGFSKDHRSDMPQVMLGLFVDEEGYPFDFDVFAGKTFEGHTLEHMVERIRDKFAQLTVVADAGMLSADNLDLLEEKGVDYIVGARLKNLPKQLTNKIVNHDYGTDGEFEYSNRRLLVKYSTKRARKDELRRQRTLQKLQKRLSEKKGVVHKSKYVRVDHKVYGIDKAKVAQDARFDGLKGYMTSTKLPAKKVIDQYHNLWRVEKAFRMAKSDLQERPVYHSKPSRIQAHLLLCFVSLLIMKETETILKKGGFSLKRAIELLGQVGQGQVRVGKTTIEVERELTTETQTILDLFVGH